VSLPGANPISGLVGWLRDKRALIVLDSCEHVIGAVAAIAEVILKAAARVSILATSREPLRAEGEWLHRLPSLELPPRSDDLTPDGALPYSAVQLFNERAQAIMDGFGPAAPGRARARPGSQLRVWICLRRVLRRPTAGIRPPTAAGRAGVISSAAVR
jgi:predicted ATPase